MQLYRGQSDCAQRSSGPCNTVKMLYQSSSIEREVKIRRKGQNEREHDYDWQNHWSSFSHFAISFSMSNFGSSGLVTTVMHKTISVSMIPIVLVACRCIGWNFLENGKETQKERTASPHRKARKVANRRTIECTKKQESENRKEKERDSLSSFRPSE